MPLGLYRTTIAATLHTTPLLFSPLPNVVRRTCCAHSPLPLRYPLVSLIAVTHTFATHHHYAVYTVDLDATLPVQDPTVPSRLGTTGFITTDWLDYPDHYAMPTPGVSTTLFAAFTDAQRRCRADVWPT